MMKTCILALLAAGASAFAPASMVCLRGRIRWIEASLLERPKLYGWVRSHQANSSSGSGVHVAAVYAVESYALLYFALFVMIILHCFESFPSHFCVTPQQSQRSGSVSLNAEEMSKSIPFLVLPEKRGGSMPEHIRFDPM